MNLCRKIRALKGRFATGVCKIVKLFAIFAVHRTYNHLFKFLFYFSMSVKVDLYGKYLYRIKQLCCPRKSCKIIFKNTNFLFHYGNRFRMEVPNSFRLTFRLYIFPRGFNLLCYIDWSQVWDLSSKYDSPLWSALENMIEKHRAICVNKILFLFFF